MRIIILNDTSIQNHIGCKAVHNAHAKLFRIMRSEIVDSFCWRDLSALDALPEGTLVETVLRSPLRSAFDVCDAVVVNGEGTIHHGRGRDLLGALEAARRLGKKTYLINAVIEAVPDFHDTLRNLTGIFVREPRSAKTVERLGGRARIVPDSILSASFEDGVAGDYRNKILITDWHQSLSDTVGAAIRSFKVGAKEVMDWPMVGPRSRAWKLALSQARAARVVITARHHGAYLAAMAGTPFVCLRSNSHKIESFIELLNEPVALCDTAEQIVEALAEADFHERCSHE